MSLDPSESLLVLGGFGSWHYAIWGLWVGFARIASAIEAEGGFFFFFFDVRRLSPSSSTFTRCANPLTKQIVAALYRAAGGT
jgi:hypothetical protein